MIGTCGAAGCIDVLTIGAVIAALWGSWAFGYCAGKGTAWGPGAAGRCVRDLGHPKTGRAVPESSRKVEVMGKGEATGRDLRLAVVGALAMVSGIAMADPSDPFTTALATLTTAVTGYGGGLAAFAAVSVGFFVAIKYIKKITRAA